MTVVLGHPTPVHVLTDVEAFAQVGAEWDDLWVRVPGAAAFQRHAWLAAWSRAYAAPGRLAVVMVRDGGALVAAAALHLERRGGLAVLAAIGGPMSDVTDVLVDPVSPGAVQLLRDALLGIPGWAALDLPELPPGSRALDLVGSWPGRSWRTESSTSLELPAVPVDDALTRLPSRTAGTLRRKVRKISSLGIERTEVSRLADVPAAVDALLELHRQQWLGRGGNPEHLTRRFRDHLVGALGGLVPAAGAVLAEYRLDGELVASQIDLVTPHSVSYYLAGIAPQLRNRIDTAVLLASSDLALAQRVGAQRYSMLRGLEDYKLRWRPDVVVSERLVLVRPCSPSGAAYLAAARLRRGAVDALRPVVRTARERWSSVRARVTAARS